MISDEALQEFKKVWKDELKEDISDEKAMDEAIALLTIMNVVYRPIKKGWLKELDEKDNQVNKAFDILFNEVEKRRKMKIYFDIDGVIVGRGWKPALYATEFLKAATENHDCYWATTHCKGDTGPALAYLKGILTPEAFSCYERIKTTNWAHNKTEALDMTSDFLWFEDKPSDIEKDVLSKHNKSKNLIVVDLIANSNHLKELAKLL